MTRKRGLTRLFNGKLFARDARYGAYGNSRESAELRAGMLRKDGWMVRITKEREDYGIWWVVWKRKEKR